MISLAKTSFIFIFFACFENFNFVLREKENASTKADDILSLIINRFHDVVISFLHSKATFF